jgi:hypothetical protein
MWKIEGFDHALKIFSADVSGELAHDEVQTLLGRLFSRHLSAQNIVAGSLPMTHPDYKDFFECRTTSSGSVVLTHGNPHYSARLTTVSS